MDNEITNSVVVSSRIRLARNYQEMPFPQHLGNNISAIKELIVAANKASDFEHKVIFMDELDEIERLTLVEEHLISPALAQKEKSALILSKDKSIAIMVNEEDHIRAQCIKEGFNLKECYKIINHFDDNLSNEMPIAYDSEFGYLTACLTNVGTGMRASVMLFLPAMELTKNIDKYLDIAQNRGLTIRGVYGEGSNTMGSMYQVSNAWAMGSNEEDIIKKVEDVVLQLSAIEQGFRKEYVRASGKMFEDQVYRSYGILRYSRLISTEEFMNCIAFLKFGMAMGIINFNDIESLDKLIIEAQPAHLILSEDKQQLTPSGRDYKRAEMVRKQLEILK